jgi:hypothetical protein
MVNSCTLVQVKNKVQTNVRRIEMNKGKEPRKKGED